MGESSQKRYKTLWQKGEIARYEQFLLLLQAHKNQGLFWKGFRTFFSLYLETFESHTTLRLDKPYGLANQKFKTLEKKNNLESGW